MRTGLTYSQSMTSSINTGTTCESLPRQAVPNYKLNGLVFLPAFIRTWALNHVCRAGTVESRIRQLVMKLEYVESVQLAHPFIKGFEQVSYCVGEEEVHHVAEGDIPESVSKRKKEDIEGKEDSKVVYSTTFYIGLAIEPKQRASAVIWTPSLSNR